MQPGPPRRPAFTRSGWSKPSEHHTLQFRFEAFNAMSHPNWNMPSLNILSGAVRPGLPGTAAHANFGVVTGTSGAMRQLQLGLKYSF